MRIILQARSFPLSIMRIPSESQTQPTYLMPVESTRVRLAWLLEKRLLPRFREEKERNLREACSWNLAGYSYWPPCTISCRVRWPTSIETGDATAATAAALTVMSLLTECLPACLQSAECGRVVKALFRASGEWPFLGLLRPLLLFFFFFHSLKFLT